MGSQSVLWSFSLTAGAELNAPSVFSQRSLSCRCCLRYWLHDLGLVPLKTLVGIYVVIQDTRENSPGVHPAVLPRRVAYLSGSQSADLLSPSIEFEHLVRFMR